jgi:hypothetical protein
LAAAAAVLLALTGGLYFGLTPASAETILAAARAEAARPADRCYRVEVTPAPGGLLEHLPAPLSPPAAKLWTRGDRFVTEWHAAGRAGAWGRDGQGRVWVTASPREGLRFDADELPEPLAVACDLRGLQLETLLLDVLVDCEPRREPPVADTPLGAVRLRAEPRPGRRLGLRSVVIEVDRDTNEVRRLTLERAWRDRPLATVTFTRVEAGARADADYDLEGHLDAGADVFGRDRPAARLVAFVRLWGPRTR